MTHIDSSWRGSLALSALAAITTLFLVATPAMSHGYESGPIRIEHPWAPATMPGATVGAAYMRIKNIGATPIRLLSAATPAAGKVEVHEMSMDGDVMRMRPVEGGVVIPAGGEVAFKAGGLHFMLTDLKAPLVEEDLQPLTLTFEGGITVELELYVERGPAAPHAH